MGRNTKLTPALQKKIVALVKKGVYFSVACEKCGIDSSTGYEWRSRGEGTHGRAKSALYAEFAESIKKAEAEAEVGFLAKIQNAATNKKTIRTKRVPVTNSETNKTEMVVVEENITQEPDWTAAAWYLERKYPNRWGKRSIDILNAAQVLLDSGVLDESHKDKIDEALNNFTTEISNTFNSKSDGSN